MSKQANKTLIGTFVVSAVILAIAGIVIFGSGKIFKKTVKYVLYFDSSINGLSKGSAVVWKGVKIGSVVNITINADSNDLSIRIPVIIEIDPEKIKIRDKKNHCNTEEQLERMIKHGLKAQLQMQSFVTGMLMIDLDFRPDVPVKLVDTDKIYPEIPTSSSAMESLAKQFSKFPVEDMLKKIQAIITGIEKITTSPEILDSIHSMNQTIKDAQKVIKRVDSNVGVLTDSIRKAAVATTITVEQAQKTLVTAEGTLGKNSEIVKQVNETLSELSAAARAIENLADYIERHPESLLKGKN
jgi:paraquat-inducible protein B